MKRILDHTPLIDSYAAETILWFVFAAMVILLLFIDLRLSSKSHDGPRRKQVTITIVTVSFAILYGILICILQDHIHGFDFFSAYLTEYSLSVDNLFAFAIIFEYFKLSGQQQSRVLLWGVLGAMFFRFVFVFLGAGLISQFEWLLYFLAAVLLWSGIKMLKRTEPKEFQPHQSWIQKYVIRFLPVSYNTDTNRFFIRENKRFRVTYIFVALLFVELTDILFALDSLPAAFGITRNRELILTSNILAVMGLRNLFFILNDFLQKFYYLPKAVSLILVFISGKMTAELLGYSMDSIYSFLTIFMLLGGAIVLSIRRNRKHRITEIANKDVSLGLKQKTN
jgi:tellurite resistance protein TerC